jgi:GNAT superfamily N-acetyltransferase
MLAVLLRKARTARVVTHLYGAGAFVLLALSRLLWRLRLVRSGFVVVLDPRGYIPDPRPLPPGMTTRMLSGEEIRGFARPGHPWLNPAVIEKYLARGERCAGLLHDGALIGMVWLSQHGGVRQFGATWEPVPPAVFGHHHWVDDRYRGRGLGPKVMEEGVRAFPWPAIHVGTVEIINYRQYRSLGKQGWTVVGIVFQVGPESLGAGYGFMKPGLIRKAP